jgi:crotonobetainyl-CoA:carnitine CoA-transferase CaiB-like acyl-CoA transferase
MDVVEQSNIVRKTPGPLAGVRVVEVGLMHAGPISTGMLEALGAEVIKVEGPESGDPARNLPRVYAQDGSLLEGRGTNFETYNSGKKSVSLDLKKPEGIRLFYELIAKSDVFMHNMRPETAKKLGFDYETLLKHNPKLVFATVSGFGPTGPDAARPGLDPVGMARSGMTVALSGGSHMRPILPATAASDRMAGIMCSYGILAALFARERTGQPQRIDASLLGGAMWLGQMPLQYALFKGEELVPSPPEDTPLYTSYQGSDGRWIAIWVNNDKAWSAFCSAIGMEWLLAEPRFAITRLNAEKSQELTAILQEQFSKKTSSEWQKILSSRPEIVVQAVQLPTEVGSDPQVLANSYIVDTVHPELGRVKRMTLPLHYNNEPMGGFTQPSPRLGEHSEEVLSEILGLSDQDIRRLADEGVTRAVREKA